MRTWTDLNGTELVALNALSGEKGIYVLPSVVKMLKGDGNAAIMLHHLLYWSRSEIARSKNGWFYATTQRTTTSTGLNKGVQERVRTRLVDMGFLEQEKRGMPAKNYYRLNLDKILACLSEVQAAKLESSGVESTQQDESDQPHIVNIEENKENDTLPPTSSEYRTPAANFAKLGKRRAKINVLGGRYDDFVNWVVQTYPKNGLGLTATHAQAEKIANKLGDTFNDAKVPEADAAIKTFVQGLKNFSAAISTGAYKQQYVPNFEKFAGIGIMYGQEPHYIKWAAQAPAEDHTRKIRA